MVTMPITSHAYGIGRLVPYDYDTAIERVTEALKEEGFGVLTTINVKDTLKAKLGVEDFPRYVILGACNPHLAHRGLTAERELGLLLPCNVIVYESEEGTRVAVMDPLAALGIVGNEQIQPVAKEAHERLHRMLERL